jgi:hypothetical protein
MDCIGWLFGGDEEDRTPDLRIANATLSQLSYVPGAEFDFSQNSAGLQMAGFRVRRIC